MRIAFIGQKGIPAKIGGVERYVEDLSVRLVELGHEVLVYTRPHYTAKSLKEYRGVKLYSLPSIYSKRLDAISHTVLASFDAIFRKPDIIHYQSIGPALVCWLPKLLRPEIKIVSTLQSKDYEHQKWGWFAKLMLKLGERIMCRLSDAVLVVTKSMQVYVKDKYAVEAHYIPNGANLKKAVSDQLIKRWGLEAGNYLICVSRLIKHKGISHLIEAYNQLNTDKHLVIVGEGAFTDRYVKEVYDLAAQSANRRAKIILTGRQSGEVLSQLYQNAYLFVQPSESEGLSLALLEAMAKGKTCLVSDITENLEAIGPAGFKFQTKSVSDLAGKLQVLLDSPALVKTTGAKARQRVINYFNWDKIAKEIEVVYNKPSQAHKVRKVYKVLKVHKANA